MPSFLTVKEAAKLTGKSPSSIRRILYPIIEDDAHPDRAHIEPSVEDAQKRRVKGENFAWRISEELLRRAVPDEAKTEKGSGTPSAGTSTDLTSELIAMLRRELEVKNTQIAQQAEALANQMEQSKGLSERLRESNLLLAQLQQRIALPETTERKPAESDKAKSAAKPAAEKEKGRGSTPKPAKPKKGWFSWLRG